MKERKLETVWVDKEGFLFLLDARRVSRGREPLTAESRKRMWNLALKRHDGKTELIDGIYVWPLKRVKETLDKAGYTYETGTTVCLDI